jgi:hypothetical protein
MVEAEGKNLGQSENTRPTAGSRQSLQLTINEKVGETVERLSSGGTVKQAKE